MNDLPTAEDYRWLLSHSGFSIRELVTAIQPMDLVPEDVPTYSRLLTLALREPEPEEELSEPVVEAPIETTKKVNKKDEEPEEEAEPSNQDIMLELVKEHPDQLTSFLANKFAQHGGNRSSTNSILNRLRKQGKVKSSKKGSNTYRWRAV